MIDVYFSFFEFQFFNLCQTFRPQYMLVFHFCVAYKVIQMQTSELLNLPQKPILKLKSLEWTWHLILSVRTSQKDLKTTLHVKNNH